MIVGFLFFSLPAQKDLPVPPQTIFYFIVSEGAKNCSLTVRVFQLQDAFNRLSQAAKLCPLFTIEM